ncbi:family 16 glycosylhydrolase [Niabella sp. CJ426]|uniref:family 16 glycosylhydrolase n=1 Tax=Niabella sp. CJ426 TaxID=3393740 RepID=UPI003D04AB16
MKHYLLITFTGYILLSCTKSHTLQETPSIKTVNRAVTPSIPNGNNYVLLWEDQFDGAFLDTSKWRYRAENTVRGYATILRSNVTMSDSGTVLLAARRNGDNFTASQIATHATYLQKYGYFEARCKVNGSLGPHSSFWLQSPTMGQTLNPAVDGTEIDVFEYHLNNGANIIRHNLHWNGYGADHQSTGAINTIPGSGTGFHLFGVEWTPQEYIFYVDGVERWRTSSAVSQRSEFMLLSMEITGFGGNRFNGTYPDFLEVDYVRAYQKSLVSNAGFESSSLSPWTSWGGGISVVADGNALSGSKAVKATGNASTAAEQVISGLKPNTTYVFGASAKVSSSGQAVKLGVKAFDAAGTELRKDVTSTSYVKNTITFTTGATHTSSRIFFFKPASGTAYGDDFFLYEQ